MAYDEGNLRIVKVLFVDIARENIPDLRTWGIKWQIMPETPWREARILDPKDKELDETISKLTSKEEMGLVIIGHCLGAGLARAKAIDPKMRPKTIVVWEFDSLKCEHIYAELGLSHFCLRSKLAEKLLEVLA